MKKALVFIIVAVVLLSVGLGWRISLYRAAIDAPSGGSGVVEATQIDLSSRLTSTIVAIHAREGDHVFQGQLLVEFDCSEQDAALDEALARLAMARAAADAAKANEASAGGVSAAARQTAQASAAQARSVRTEREYALRESNRLASLHHEGVVSESALDTGETRAISAKNQEQALLASARAANAHAAAADQSRLAAAAQTLSASHAVRAADSAVRRATILAGECQMRSPIDGVLLRRNFEPGELALPGSCVVSIVNLLDAKATIYLPNAELAEAEPGRAVEVVADAWPGEVFAGTITYVSSRAEFTPRNIQTRTDRDRLVYAVEVTIPNTRERLRPGMPVDVSIPRLGRH